ncbi:Protein-methionine-sulfoxide reductase heme-binding subunit MsrQ [Methylobacterium adhaesivum]|uniref:Protein-methionine-sulfoxide reductase heme-binding subunit MsrQ n=1 Tax=Methylobacterium adhaesivum TaxID=333297 RepID=A0ABT8BN81_9HYPH|nr:protein-methionine-sulfoxide reductase heme-binding subunit MsrQ [Methylobacterium adhaesivum]MDN3592691.1 protein-methionine-sulfoxide reductase heme-binding subunit MsrQ [Methylobacterium adhaesivum]GJD29325.1 Protein-methionine-sulfoxide reductase heme-binding subunit MsrQ [Methylobacterium adhaesivum]
MPALPAFSAPWRDRAGRLSGLKLATFLFALAPGLWLAGAYAADALGAKPITALLHGTGEWAVRFLLLSLAVTPLRRIANFPKLILVRRMLGLTVLAYALIHLGLYVVDQNFVLTKVVTEIATRIYLTIGFAALIGLAVLGATSTDGMIRRLGKAWPRLHKAVYTITVLGLVHYFLQAKIDVSDPVFWTGAFLLLMGWRFLQARRWPSNPLTLTALAVGVALATAGLEAAWYGLASGIPAERVLQANLAFPSLIRPAWWVLALGLTLPALNAARLAWDRFGGGKPVRSSPGAAAVAR